MGDPMELEAELAETLRTEARERGFADADAYLRWLVHNRQRVFDTGVLSDRLDDVERRLEAIESHLRTEDADSRVWDDDEVTEVIDNALDDPSGARDDDVATAINDAEDDRRRR